MKISLVIMAAGLGTRYGGNKQTDGIGPHGEMLMEYSIYDALRAGFHKVVFIIKPEMREGMEALFSRRLAGKTALDGSPVETAYVHQDFSSIPSFYSIPPERTRPFGTVHALLCPPPPPPLFTPPPLNGPAPSAPSTPCSAPRRRWRSPAVSSTPTTFTGWTPIRPWPGSSAASPRRGRPPWWAIC